LAGIAEWVRKQTNFVVALEVAGSNPRCGYFRNNIIINYRRITATK
jgi:hypothetical protein